MIPIDAEYEVIDKQGRNWGIVTLKYVNESESMNGTISGYLAPTDDFASVAEIFKEHSRLLSIPGSLESKEVNTSTDKIIELGVKLVNSQTGDELEVGPAFVSEKMLFTCDLNERKKI